jgi:hypothetical protein
MSTAEIENTFGAGFFEGVWYGAVLALGCDSVFMKNEVVFGSLLIGAAFIAGMVRQVVGPPEVRMKKRMIGMSCGVLIAANVGVIAGWYLITHNS